MSRLSAAMRRQIGVLFGADPILSPGDGDAGSAASRERARRRRVLARMSVLMVAYVVVMAPDCAILRPWWNYAAALASAVVLRMVAARLNVLGRVGAAARLSIVALCVAGTIAVLGGPSDNLFPATYMWAFFLVAIVQAGFLLHRNSPYVVAGYTCAVVAAQTARYLGNPVAVHQIGGMANVWMSGVLAGQVTCLFAVITSLNAGVTERALALADRSQEVERLNGQLCRQHEELSAAHARATREADEAAAANAELLQVKQELEASYRHLEALNGQLEAQATSDPLTGLGNRRALHEHLQARVAQALRTQQPLALLMVDVDRFKQYNDDYGHPAGDEGLRAIGRLLTETTRLGDVAARFGGEEFAVILPDTTLEDALVVAERIRETVAAHAFVHGHLTVSLGVAAMPLHAGEAETLVREADMALYRAKSAGRDCVVSASHKASGDAAPPELTVLAPMAPRTESIPPAHAHALLLNDGFGGVEGLLQEPSGPFLVSLLAALDVRDSESNGHSMRVARYTLRLARALGDVYERRRNHRALVPWLSPDDMRAMALGALLHDIGKMRIPDQILRKKEPLTEEEWAIVRRHPVVGAEVVYEFPMLAPAMPVVLHHHERWDGTGYPDGLAGEAIPIAARIFAICDTLDAITTNRAYRPAMPYSMAAKEICRQAGTQFDPAVVEAFLDVPESDWVELRGSDVPAQSPQAAA